MKQYFCTLLIIICNYRFPVADFKEHVESFVLSM